MWFADLDTETISDTGSSTTVLVVTLLLVAFGVGLASVTVWFWRQTAPDPDALGPLSVMSRRRFASLGAIEQRRLMDEARPGFVAPVEPARDVESSSGETEGPASSNDLDDASLLEDLDAASDELVDELSDDDIAPEADGPSGESVGGSDEWESEHPRRFIDPLLGR